MWNGFNVEDNGEEWFGEETSRVEWNGVVLSGVE